MVAIFSETLLYVQGTFYLVLAGIRTTFKIISSKNV